MEAVKHLYEVRPRKDKRGIDLISDALPFGDCGMASRMQSSTQSTTPSFTADCPGSGTLNGRFKKPV
jgi:hypothetical protein